MTNPFMDPPEGDEVEVTHDDDVLEEDELPLTEQPVRHVNWLCSGVKLRNLTKVGPEPHLVQGDQQPDQPTTDASGRLRAGRCNECGATTIWKEVTL